MAILQIGRQSEGNKFRSNIRGYSSMVLLPFLFNSKSGLWWFIIMWQADKASLCLYGIWLDSYFIQRLFSNAHSIIQAKKCNLIPTLHIFSRKCQIIPTLVALSAVKWASKKMGDLWSSRKMGDLPIPSRYEMFFTEILVDWIVDAKLCLFREIDWWHWSKTTFTLEFYPVIHFVFIFFWNGPKHPLSSRHSRREQLRLCD